jgi:hypothetical protein
MVSSNKTACRRPLTAKILRKVQMATHAAQAITTRGRIHAPIAL